MTAIARLLRRYRHRRAFRASLVKRPLNVALLCVGMSRFNRLNPAGLRRLMERVWG